MTDIVSLQGTLYTSRNPTRRWLHTTRRDLVIEAIRTAPVSHLDRALEVGPGSGVYLPSLCERFKSVVAIDVEEAHIAQLRKSADRFRNLNLVVGDLKVQQWSEGFDLVLCSEVIEHVADPKSFMVSLAKAVQSGGILILSTPQPWSLMELTASVALSPVVIGLTRLIYREPVLPTGHISVMPRREVTRMLRDHGFELLTSSYFGLYVPVIAEFGGKLGVSILRRLEKSLQRHGPHGVLWTQLHLARKG
jgi:2-polyprenyl-3-methyl-5-hydroxy-6-metoxy-1,4-benzoquinol methylase